MDVQIKKGLTEGLVLAVISRGDTYGYKLTQDTAGIIPLSESTLYPVLRRLEAQGCVKTYMRQHSNRLRKYYAITDNGLGKLKDYQGQWREAQKVINFICQEDGQ